MVVLTLTLAGCGSTGTRVTDFSDRSLGYGWLDIKDVSANRLHSVDIYQLRPRANEPYYAAAVREFKGGFLYYTMALPNGAFKLYSAAGQRCLGFLCSKVTYAYSFGKQGDDTGVIITAPGVYHFGSYKLKDAKSGLFEPGKFEILESANVPSKRELLEEILKYVDEPPIAERIRRELAQLR
jgi:hypothetical protein